MFVLDMVFVEIGGNFIFYFFWGYYLILWMDKVLGTKYFKSRESIFFFLMYYLIKLMKISSCNSSVAQGLPRGFFFIIFR